MRGVVYRHIEYIANATDLPVMVYDGGAGIELSLPLLKRLADTLPTMHCAKLFLPYPAKIAQYEAATGGKLQAWAGHDQMNYLILCYGAKGMTSVASCILPKEQSDMFNFIQTGNLDAAGQYFMTK